MVGRWLSFSECCVTTRAPLTEGRRTIRAKIYIFQNGREEWDVGRCVDRGKFDSSLAFVCRWVPQGAYISRVVGTTSDPWCGPRVSLCVMPALGSLLGASVSQSHAWLAMNVGRWEFVRKTDDRHNGK